MRRTLLYKMLLPPVPLLPACSSWAVWRARRRGLALALVLALAAAGGFATPVLLAQYRAHQDLTCLARNVYFEARGEPPAGQYAVAEVTMNRVASGRYPDTVCGVVYEKRWDSIRQREVAAFSWTDAPEQPPPQGAAWQRAWAIAEEVYYRHRDPILPGATHFHASHVQPNWSQEKTVVARIGRHVFYK